MNGAQEEQDGYEDGGADEGVHEKEADDGSLKGQVPKGVPGQRAVVEGAAEAGKPAMLFAFECLDPGLEHNSFLLAFYNQGSLLKVNASTTTKQTT